MAKIIGKGFQRDSALSPGLLQNQRVLSCGLHNISSPALAYTWTMPVGQDVRVKQVNVTAYLVRGCVNPNWGFRIQSGFGRPRSHAAQNEWEQLVPAFDRETLINWDIRCGDFDHTWDMDLLLKGTGRRFGMTVNNNSTRNLYIYLSVLIEEVGR